MKKFGGPGWAGWVGWAGWAGGAGWAGWASWDGWAGWAGLGWAGWAGPMRKSAPDGGGDFLHTSLLILSFLICWRCSKCHCC